MADSVAIDARDDMALAVVCGVPLVIRLLRGLSRTDTERATLYASDREGAAALSRALADYPVKSSITVEVETADAEVELGDGALCGWGIYTRDALARVGADTVEPEMRIADRADRQKARRYLFASIRKTIAQDGIIAYYAQRPLSRLITALLVNTRISANQSTLFSLASGLIAAFFAARGDHLGFALAGVGYFFSGIFDCVDGDLARLRIEMSKLGEWLDSMADELNTLSLLCGIGVGLERGGADSIWLLICLVGGGIGALGLAWQYVEMHRLGVSIDSAQFPWFFRSEDDESTQHTATGPVGWVLIAVGYMLRRDFNVIGISILLFLDLPKVAGAIIATALVAVACLTVVHFAVKAMRRGSDPPP